METEDDGRNRTPAAEEESVAARLIEKATTSTMPEVDPRLLKAIKSVVRNSDSELRHASRTLIYLMKRDHSQVRYLSLLIIDELFMRSKLFRTILVENLDLLLSLSIGFRRNLPLPAPASVASVLRSKAIEFLEKWNVAFGVHYRQLRLGYDYLKNTLRYQFPNLQANAERIRQERKEREIKTREILLSKFETLKVNLAWIKDDIHSTVDEVNECMDIIRNEDDDDIPLEPVDGQEMELFHNSELRQIRLDSLREGEKVEENSENKVVFDAIRELYKVIVTKHLVTVQEWISVLIRVEVTDTRFRDSTLKEFIDIRNNLRLVKKKCEESGCSLNKTTSVEEEEDIWEEGTLDLSNGKSPTAIANSELKDKVTECSNPTSKGKKKVVNERRCPDSNPLKMKLLSEAPVVPWGSSLDYWDSSQRDVPANQRGLDIEGHWGRVDRDAVIPAEKIAELRMQASVYKEEPVEIQPCRAPLRKGGLCVRKDLRVCPFHGPIVPRDDEGKPIHVQSSIDEEILYDVKNSGSSSEEDIPPPDIVEKLAKHAVSNLRERDKEVAKKKASKRAKLAKVREHNAAVLRDAAVASTSAFSHIGNDDSRSSAKNKKDSLMSMLKKKVTAKDRLSQKLLTTRARDATTRQLTMAEESKYREAFPNQW